VLNILENLSIDEIELLRQPLWLTSVDLSFKLNGHDFIDGDIRGPLPILSGPSNDPILIFDQDLMIGINEKGTTTTTTTTTTSTTIINTNTTITS
jgi:hypothetical protein